MTARTPMRLSFRTRLGLIITMVFIAAGAGLLTVQYFVVQQLFATAMWVTTVSCAVDGDEPPVVHETIEEATGCGLIGSSGYPGPPPLDGSGPTQFQGSGADEFTAGAVIRQSIFLSNEVGGGLLIWSIVLLVVFAAIAAAIAFWLSRRSLDRIGEVTAATRDISERDLGRRLDLPGPHDEIKELGDTIDGMLDRLQLAFAAQDRFVANASHELRTPLTTTRAALEIPLEQGAVPRSLEPNVRRALRATEQSERLITALLALARSRAGIDGAGPLDLAEVTRGELDDLSGAAREWGIEVHAEISTVSAVGEPVLVARAVRNLLDNGIRHNIQGGELHVRVHREGADAVVEVANTGTAVTPASLALLAEPFYRGDASRTSHGEGVGLGLAIVESVAATHGGRLELTARDGGGLIARLTLPAEPT
ncbi:MAG: histidine kinase [Rhodoglobus sp.]|nr:histidine kinase [Rhodoglobus sp.]